MQPSWKGYKDSEITSTINCAQYDLENAIKGWFYVDFNKLIKVAAYLQPFNILIPNHELVTLSVHALPSTIWQLLVHQALNSNWVQLSS